MTQGKTSHAAESGLPGLSKISDVVSAYASAWDRHVQALNQAWADCTRAEASASDWPKAWGRLVQTWSDSVFEICNAYTFHGSASGSGGSPFVAFVIDQSAHTDAEPQTVPLPPGVDTARIVASPLVLIEEREPAPVPAVPRIAGKVIPLHKAGRIEIRVSIDPVTGSLPAGHYLSVVYERKAGDPPFVVTPSNPPPRPVIATVLVMILKSPI